MRFFKRSLIVAILFLASFAQASEAERPTYKLNLENDFPVTLAAGGMFGIGMFLYSRMDSPNNPKDKGDLLPWDKPLAGRYSENADKARIENEIKTEARNIISAFPGQKVLLETESGRFYKAAFMVYILPFIFFFIGYAVAAALGAAEGICMLVSALAFFAGIAFLPDLVLLTHCGRRNRQDHQHRQDQRCKTLHLLQSPSRFAGLLPASPCQTPYRSRHVRLRRIRR